MVIKFIFLFLTFAIVQASEIIRVKMICTYNSCQSDFSIKGFPRNVRLHYEMGIDFCYLNQDIFTKNQEIKDNTTSLTLNQKAYTESTLNVDLSFTSESQSIFVDKFPFMISPRSNQIKHSGSIGLSLKVYNEKYSFIHHLYHLKIINHLIFGIDKNNHNNESEIFFGGIPKEILENKGQIKIKVDDTFNKWGFNFSQFYFGEKLFIFNNDKYSFIDIKNDRIFAPYGVMKHLLQTVFKNYLNNQICSVNKQGDKEAINCKCSGVTDFPSMTFIIDKKIVTIPGKNLFSPLNSPTNCLFLIQQNFQEGKFNTWVFGHKFLDSFITEFNYEEKAIILYSENFEKTIMTNTSLSTVGHIILIAVILAGFSLVIFIQRKFFF